VTVADVVNLFRSGLGVRLPMLDDPGRREIDGILDEVDRDLERHAGAVSFRQLAARLGEIEPTPDEPQPEERRGSEEPRPSRPRTDVS